MSGVRDRVIEIRLRAAARELVPKLEMVGLSAAGQLTHVDDESLEVLEGVPEIEIEIRVVVEARTVGRLRDHALQARLAVRAIADQGVVGRSREVGRTRQVLEHPLMG